MGRHRLWLPCLCACGRGRARAVAVGAGVRVGAFVHLVIEEECFVCGRVIDARRRVEVFGANVLVGLRLDELQAQVRQGGGELTCVRGERGVVGLCQGVWREGGRRKREVGQPLRFP